MIKINRRNNHFRRSDLRNDYSNYLTEIPEIIRELSFTDFCDFKPSYVVVGIYSIKRNFLYLCRTNKSVS